MAIAWKICVNSSHDCNDCRVASALTNDIYSEPYLSRIRVFCVTIEATYSDIKKPSYNSLWLS